MEKMFTFFGIPVDESPKDSWLCWFLLSLQNKVRQQGLFESLHRDLMVGFGTWEFDPMHLTNPLPQTSSSVHIWQGYEDRIVPAQLQRYVSSRLPWIQYHEVPDGGHLLLYDTGIFDSILRALLH